MSPPPSYAKVGRCTQCGRHGELLPSTRSTTTAGGRRVSDELGGWRCRSCMDGERPNSYDAALRRDCKRCGARGGRLCYDHNGERMYGVHAER